MTHRIVFRTESSSRTNVGTGHLARSRLLAEALQGKGAEVVLYSHASDSAVFARALAKLRPHMVVFDQWRNNISELRAAKKSGAIVALMDGSGRSREWTDIAIDSLWDDPKYLVLPPMHRRQRPHVAQARTLVCSFGGHDARALMPKVWAALASENTFRKVWCFCDSTYHGKETTRRWKRRLGNRVEFFFNDPRLQLYLEKADMGLTAGGLTLFQALACGLPVAVIGQYAHQTSRAKDFEKKGLAMHVGSMPVLKALHALRNSQSLREKFSRNGMRYVDGKGLARVTEWLWRVLKDQTRFGTRNDHIHFRPWDTRFFGVRIGEAWESTSDVLREARRKKIQCLYLFCDAPAQAKLVETRRVYTCRIAARACKAKASKSLRLVQRKDLPALRTMAWTFVAHSRFARDGHFSTSLCRAYYERYVDKEYKENPGSFWVAVKGAQLQGFVSCRKESALQGRIVLVAVAAHAQRQGWGIALIEKAKAWAAREGLEELLVQTQQQNRASCALYEKAGFRLARQQNIYHYWLAMKTKRGAHD